MRRAEEADQQQQADDAELGHRLEEERVSVAHGHRQGAVLVPVGLVAAGADAIERMVIEGVERRRPELIAAAAAAAAQMGRNVGALGLERSDLLELGPPGRGVGDQDPRDDRHQCRGDHPARQPARNLEPLEPPIDQEPQDPEGHDHGDRERQHLVALAGRG